jgi:hypothetical protein
MNEKRAKLTSRNSLRQFTSEKNKPDYGVNNGVSNKGSQYTLLYQAPIIQAKKPKNLQGPFDVYDVPDIRQAIEKRFKFDLERKKQDAILSHQFVDDLNLNNYFSKKSNWITKTKFINTYSLYSAMNVYLPNYKVKSPRKFESNETVNKNYKIDKISSNKSEKNARGYESESKLISGSIV